MLHFLPLPSADSAPAPYAEAVARLASIRQALHMVEQFELGEPPRAAIDSGHDRDQQMATAWPATARATRRCFAERSARTASVAAAGLEVILAQRVEGMTPNPASVEKLAAAIRAGIEELDALMAPHHRR